MENTTITVYDHKSHPIWAIKYRDKFIRKNRTNGAFTYSQDIVTHHLPVIKNVLYHQTKFKHILISTVSKLEKRIIPYRTDLIICYLHESVNREFPRCLANQEFYHNDIIYITSRKPLYEKLINYGFNSIFIPMAIDTEPLKKFQKPDNQKHQDNRVIYFGNKYMGKDIIFKPTKRAFIDKGWIFDEICENMFNKDSKKLQRDEILEIISKYKYGIGGGRCILEMNALGVKTIICLYANNGIITNDADFELHKEYNFASLDKWTFSPNIKECIDNFDKAIIKTLDVKDILLDIKEQLETIIYNL